MLRYRGLLYNIIYIIVFVYMVNRGWTLWFLIGTVVFTFVLHHRKMFAMMKLMSKEYVKWCDKTGEKILKKMRKQ